MSAFYQTLLIGMMLLTVSACGKVKLPPDDEAPASSTAPTQSSDSSIPPSNVISASTSSSSPSSSRPPTNSSSDFTQIPSSTSSLNSSEAVASSNASFSSSLADIGSTSSTNTSAAMSSASSTSPSSRSSAMQSSSTGTFNGDATAGKQEFAARCNFCHVDQMSGEFKAGVFAFNTAEFTYPSMSKYQGYQAEKVEQLADFIDHNMPSASSCNDACARDIAAYLWRYRDAASNPIALDSLSFNEQGLNIELFCLDPSDNLSLRIIDRSTSSTVIDDFTPVISRSNGVSVTQMNSIVTDIQNNHFTLSGSGDDIWLDQIFFNGLRKTLSNTQLDLSLTINHVENNQHDFSKIGLLVSSSNDLSGELLLIHWAGKNGLAEDSGLAELIEYSQLLGNPDDQLTPVPATVRVAYRDNHLLVGGCYDCTTPTLQPAAFADFVPQSVFIIASAHHTQDIIAALTITDAFSNTPQYQVLTETTASCNAISHTVNIDATTLANVDQLTVELYQGNRLLDQATAQREYSGDKSCASQNDLLAPKLRRLSELQIKNSLQDIFGNIFDDGVWPKMEDGAKLIGMNTQADKLNINSLNFERMYDASRSLVGTLLDRHQELQACIEMAGSSCVNDLINTYGERLWRRPLSALELAELESSFASFNSRREILEYAFNALILSSNFLFRSELGSSNGVVLQLNNYEIISLLSFSIWNSTPDQILLDLAAQPSPLTTAQITAQAERLLDNNKATAALMEIYKDFLKLELVLTREKAADYQFNQNVRETLLMSAEKMLADNIQAQANYMDVFAGNQYYVNDAIASFFNVNSSDSILRSNTFDTSQRNGILNHPAFLSVHSTLSQSGIVKRGVFTLEQLLCQDLPDPPGDVMPLPTPENIDPDQTSERDLLQITHSTQPSCVGCHQFIDPAGFGFENFDAVGRYRTIEKNNVPIDASGILAGVGSQTLSYQNSAEYSRELVNSPQMQQCVSRRFLEHYLSQELPADSCEFKKYQAQIQTLGQPVQNLVRALIKLESFSQRQLLQ